MEKYQPETYGEKIADIYDDWYSSPDESSISLLSDLADRGRVLELGIGTGRVYRISIDNSGHHSGIRFKKSTGSTTGFNHLPIIF